MTIGSLHRVKLSAEVTFDLFERNIAFLTMVKDLSFVLSSDPLLNYCI